jgi:predicted RNA-binding protein with PIN domain
MILIVDGYNVLKQAKGARATEAEKQDFIKNLVRYAHEKNHEVVLVFDGGHSMYPSKEREGSIIIVHAGIHQSADDYIKKIVEKEEGKECLLVSSDNELCFFAHRREIPSIDALAFFRLMHEKKGEIVTGGPGGKLQKLSTTPADKELDELMEEESKRVQFKKEDEIEKRVRGQQHKKHEKVLLKKIKKL